MERLSLSQLTTLRLGGEPARMVEARTEGELAELVRSAYEPLLVLAALDVGVSSFESSFGDLGGCPVPKGATGNVTTEDVLSMLHEMGHETGIDLEALLAAARDVQQVLGRPLGSHLLTAGPVVWNDGA